MSCAYVPGLKVTPLTDLHLVRQLPLKGTVKVQVGSLVQWNTTVAQTFLPGGVEMINLAAKLGVEPQELPSCLLVPEGSQTVKNQPIAQSKGFFGYFKNTFESPTEAVLESVSEISGQIVLRKPPVPVEINAYAQGVIEKIIPEEGVVVFTKGAFLQGIFGIGPEAVGDLVVVALNPQDQMTLEDIKPEHKGKIVVGGALVSSTVLKKAIETGVKGIIAGGIDDKDLRDFLGYDLGVAITGSEDKGITLVITEGFGKITMADRTFNLLKENQGRLASISGATQIRAGVIRPEIIIPVADMDFAKELDLYNKSKENNSQSISKDEENEEETGLNIGTQVRIIREPNFGRKAKVTALPGQLTQIPTGAKVRVAQVTFPEGDLMLVPRANLEIIES